MLVPNFPSHRLVIDAGDLSTPVVFNVEEFQSASTALETAASRTTVAEHTPLSDVHSPFLLVQPQDAFTADNQEVTIEIALTSESGRATYVYRANEISRWIFQRLDTEVKDGLAIARTDRGGIFAAASQQEMVVETPSQDLVAVSPYNPELIAGLTVMGVLLLIVLLMVGMVVTFFVVRRDKWHSLKKKTRKAKVQFTRNFAKQI